MEKKLSTLIVGADRSYQKVLQMFVQDIGYQVIANVYDVTKANQVVRLKDPDLVLMDLDRITVQTSIEAAMAIQELDIPIIAMKSRGTTNPFEKEQAINVVDYLSKPTSKYMLRSAIRQAHNTFILKNTLASKHKNTLPNSSHLLLKKENIFYKVPLKKVVYIKAENNYSIVYTEQDQFISTSDLEGLATILAQLPFRRVHKKYIVNKLKITAIDYFNHKIFIGAVEVPFSQKLKEELMGYFKEQIG